MSSLNVSPRGVEPIAGLIAIASFAPFPALSPPCLVEPISGLIAIATFAPFVVGRGRDATGTLGLEPNDAVVVVLSSGFASQLISTDFDGTVYPSVSMDSWSP